MFSKMQYVYAIYKEKSFTKAADKLCISQPYLSAAIKRIEQQIGAPLFERKSSSVVPTEIGYEYIRALEQITDIEKKFATKIADITDMEQGSLDIGCSVYCSTYVIPQILKEFSSLYPKIKISLIDAGDAQLKTNLVNEEIDFSFNDETVVLRLLQSVDGTITCTNMTIVYNIGCICCVQCFESINCERCTN